MSGPRFSIVMLLPDSRGIAEQSVRAWTAGQDFPREGFELIAVGDGSEADTEARIPPLLGATDRLLLYPGATRTELYDRGARAAGGEFVVFTESHCLAEPTFLRELDQFLRSSGACGACCRGVPLCRDALGRLAAKCFEEGYRQYCRPEDWRKVNIHAFAIRRDVYLEVGGLNPRYGIFAEMLLAAELWRRGHRPGFAEGPTVWHQFDGSASESAAFNRDAVAGEMRYYRDHPRGPHVQHTFLADGDSPWSIRDLECAAFAALWSERRRVRWRERWLMLQQGWRALKLAVGEGWPGRVVDRATMILGAAGCRLLGSESVRAHRLYLRSWAAAARLARKRFLAKEAEENRTPVPTSYRINEIPEHDLWGFHLPEHWQGEPMRWMGRCGVMRLPRPGNACELILHTNGVGWPVAERPISFHVDGQRLAAGAVTIELERIRLRVDAAVKRGPMLLAVVCDPVKPEQRGSDRRELGVPLFRIEVGPVRPTLVRAA